MEGIAATKQRVYDNSTSLVRCGICGICFSLSWEGTLFQNTFGGNETRYKEQTTYIQLGNDGESTRSRKEAALEES